MHDVSCYITPSTGASGPTKPGPEVKKLDYNIGTWNVEGEAKPFGPMPGGKFTATEKCEWYSGGFFVVCHSEGAGPMGPAKGVSFMGYDPNEKVYTYHEFTSTGEAIDSKGTVSGDTWDWTAESKMGNAKISVRVTIKEVSKTEYTGKTRAKYPRLLGAEEGCRPRHTHPQTR